MSSAPKDVAQDNENRYHKFAAEGAPGLQLDLAFEGAPGLQPDLASEGAPSLQPDLALDLEGAPSLQPDLALEGAPGLQPDLALEGAPGLQLDLALEGAPEELPDLASKGAPGVLPDLASGDACTRMMSEGVPGITSNLCPGTFGVMSDLSSGADLFSGADLLSGVTSNLCPRVTSDLASGVTTNLQTNVSSGVMSDLNMDTPPDHAGLNPPALASNPTSPVTGADTKLLRKQNKRHRQQRQIEQQWSDVWKTHKGQFSIPTPKQPPSQYRNSMCPTGLALEHPAAETLLQYATKGCPTRTGKNWTKEMIEEAIARGPHVSATAPDAIAYFQSEIEQKVAAGQAKVVLWDDIKDNFPPQLKISPLALVPHKSRLFRAILDLSFRLRLQSGGFIPSVNETSEKTAPQAACEQLGHVLRRIIHAFAEADEDAKIFMAKFDIKDGFWRMDCAEGEEWNFAYVMPQEEGQPVRLVVPTSLQMGWIESPPYFCAASETGRDVAEDYVETPIGSRPVHKFEIYTKGDSAYQDLPPTATGEMKYLVEVYVDDFISLAIPTSQEQLDHVARGVLQGIHDVFPANDDDSMDAIALKKLLKEDGKWMLEKDLLGFMFDGDEKTLWLEEPKRLALLQILKNWLRTSNRSDRGIPFDEFYSVICRIRHAFTSVPAGMGLLSHCNDVIRLNPRFVFLQRNKNLYNSISAIRTFLRETAAMPTKCRQLVLGHPHFIGIKDASSFGVGGVVVGEKDEVVPTVFRLEWPQEIRDALISFNNPDGSITNSDLEMAGLLLLWLVMEEICPDLLHKHVALFSDNQPTVCWVKRMASRNSFIAKCILQILAMRLKIRQTSPLTPQHIRGEHNAIADIPSRSFGSNSQWHFKTHDELLTFFNNTFPLPHQASWTVFQISNKISTRVISLLLTKRFELEEWRRLPPLGKHIGSTGKAIANLWEWTLTCRTAPPPTQSEHGSSLASQQESEVDSMEEDAKSKLTQHVALSLPLARPSRWTLGSTLPKKTTGPN